MKYQNITAEIEKAQYFKCARNVLSFINLSQTDFKESTNTWKSMCDIITASYCYNMGRSACMLNN